MNKIRKHIKDFGASNKQLFIGLLIGFAIVVPVSATMINSSSQEAKKSTQAKQSGATKTDPLTQTKDEPNPKNSGTKATTGSNAKGTTAASTSSTTGASKTTSVKINNWQVSIYQINVTSCGTYANPCPWPTGVILSIAAKNTDTGAYIPLKDCSITSGPVGFSIPGGSYSANPTIYSDAGVPVCGGSIDFPVGGHYRFGYEVWLPDGTNVDLPYRGGVLMDYYLQPNH